MQIPRFAKKSLRRKCEPQFAGGAAVEIGDLYRESVEADRIGHREGHLIDTVTDGYKKTVAEVLGIAQLEHRPHRIIMANHLVDGFEGQLGPGIGTLTTAYADDQGQGQCAYQEIA